MPASGLGLAYKSLLGIASAAIVSAVVWAVVDAVSSPPPRVEACEIECSGCQGVRQAWLRLEGGDTYVVRTRGNVIEFFCPFERVTVAVILEIEDENLRISYKSARIEVDPGEETILVRAEDFADDPLNVADLAGAKRLESRWCGRGSAVTADGCRRMECPEGQVRRDGRCVRLLCAEDHMLVGTSCMPRCAQDEIAKNGRCLARCGDNERFENGTCVPRHDDGVPEVPQPELGERDDRGKTVAVVQQPKPKTREKPASVDVLTSASNSSVDCVLDPSKCQIKLDRRFEYRAEEAREKAKSSNEEVNLLPEKLELPDIIAGVGPAKEAASAKCSMLSKGGEKTKVRVSIRGPTGKVVSATVLEDGGRPDLARCVADELKNAAFKRVQKEQIGTEVTVQF